MQLCRDQAYDGASNMAGHLNRVAAGLQKEEPEAHFVHLPCLAHSLNLCLHEQLAMCQRCFGFNYTVGKPHSCLTQMLSTTSDSQRLVSSRCFRVKTFVSNKVDSSHECHRCNSQQLRCYLLGVWANKWRILWWASREGRGSTCTNGEYSSVFC